MNTLKENAAGLRHPHRPLATWQPMARPGGTGRGTGNSHRAPPASPRTLGRRQWTRVAWSPNRRRRRGTGVGGLQGCCCNLREHPEHIRSPSGVSTPERLLETFGHMPYASPDGPFGCPPLRGPPLNKGGVASPSPPACTAKNVLLPKTDAN